MYWTKAFAVSLVTETPRSANEVTFCAEASVDLSTMISRQDLPFRKAKRSFSTPVSMLTNRSTGITGWGQATRVAKLEDFNTPVSSASHSPASSSMGWPVNMVTLPASIRPSGRETVSQYRLYMVLNPTNPCRLA